MMDIVLDGRIVDVVTNPLAQKHFVDDNAAAERRKKTIERNRWLIAGSKCKTLSNEVEEEVIFSHSDQKKWKDIQYQFILLRHFIKYPPIMGQIEQIFAEFLDEISEVEPDLISRIRSELQRMNIPPVPPTYRTFFPPYLSNGSTIDHPSIKVFIRATASFLNFLVDNDREDYRRIRDGVYASMGLLSPDKLREDVVARRQKK